MPAPPAQNRVLQKLFEGESLEKKHFFCCTLMLQRISRQRQWLFFRSVLRRQPESSNLQMFSHLISAELDAVDRSGRKRRLVDSAFRNLGSDCGGVVYGVTLGALLAFCGCKKGNTPHAVRVIQASFQQIQTSVKAMSGADKQLLVSGLFSNRQSRSQINYVNENTNNGAEQSNVQVSSRHGSSSMLVGATATIFCVFTVLSNRAAALATGASEESFNSDIEFLNQSRSILETTVKAELALRGAAPRCGFGAAPAFEVDSIEAEIRALQRAKVGIRFAMEVAETQRLNCAQTIRLQLEYYSRAAFPATCLDSRTHSTVLSAIANPAFFGLSIQQAGPLQAARYQGDFVVPLAQLSGLARDGATGGNSDTASFSASAASRQLSNASSRASDAGSEIDSFKVLEL
jgi:hypothetical protein